MVDDYSDEPKQNSVLLGLSSIPPYAIILVGAMILVFLWLNNNLKTQYILGDAIGVIVLLALSHMQNVRRYLTYIEAVDIIEKTIPKLQKIGELPKGTFYVTPGSDRVPSLMDSFIPREWRIAGRIIEKDNTRNNYIVKVDPLRLECGGIGLTGIVELKRGDLYRGEDVIYKPVYIHDKGDMFINDEISRRQSPGSERRT